MTKAIEKMKDASANSPSGMRPRERGAALITTMLILALLAVITMSVMAVVTPEMRIAGSDLQRTQTFYASAAGMEKMTSDLSDLFSRTSNPAPGQLFRIQKSPPPELVKSGFYFDQTLLPDNNALNALRRRQGIPATSFPTVNIPSGPYAGLTATISPYILTSNVTQVATRAQVALQREVNSYLIPLFQFGMFSDEDIELHPGPAFTFNGRVHANGNIYVNGNVTFLSKVTAANEFVTDVLRNGSTRTGSNVSMQVGSFTVPITMGSVVGGPDFANALEGERGFFPGSPQGSPNANWESVSVGAAQSGVANQFGGQLLTRTTGAVPLLLPLQLGGNPTREIIKRSMPNDGQILSQSRYQSKAQIRILLDDEGSSAADASGIPFGEGLPLSGFVPEPLPENVPLGAGGGRALWRIRDDGTYVDTTTTAMLEESTSGLQADTVRGVKAMPGASPSPAPTPAPDYSSNGVGIPWGAGLSGRILIQIVDADGNTFDVTKQILSMGVTEGEPNGIVYLQRPLWAAFTQGSRDASGGNNCLTYLVNGPDPYTNGTNIGISGRIDTASVVQDGTYGYLLNLKEETSNGAGVRKDSPGPAGDWNSIVPINLYNVREGRISSSLPGTQLYQRGMTNVVELNMRNLARWVDGVYNTNLLAGTRATAENIDSSNGYVVYISDRRGDKVKQEIDAAGVRLNTTNGMVDNEDIYGPNGSLDPGEDVIDFGLDLSTGLAKQFSLQKDQSELPDPNQLSVGFPITVGGAISERTASAKSAAAWANPLNYFRRSIRLFNGEKLQTTAPARNLSATKGLTIATENMVYIWGNYNTTGINGQPVGGSTLNDPAQSYYYSGSQVSASIVADAFFPLSKTWFDSSSALYPEDLNRRLADLNLPSVGNETAVRAGIIAGNNVSALSGSPDAGNSGSNESRLNGGMHNFPRFLENWGNRRWNFVGAIIPLYHSTQALGPYNADSSIYSPPIRNWAFDISFTDPTRLPPGTPSFEYIMSTGFRQVF